MKLVSFQIFWAYFNLKMDFKSILNIFNEIGTMRNGTFETIQMDRISEPIFPIETKLQKLLFLIQVFLHNLIANWMAFLSAGAMIDGVLSENALFQIWWNSHLGSVLRNSWNKNSSATISKLNRQCHIESTSLFIFQYEPS